MASAVSLTLNDLAANSVRCLMVVGAHALHLNVLNLRRTTVILLVQAGAFASKELLLLSIATARNDTVFKLVRFGCWALGLRELLGHNTIGLVDCV